VSFYFTANIAMRLHAPRARWVLDRCHKHRHQRLAMICYQEGLVFLPLSSSWTIFKQFGSPFLYVRAFTADLNPGPVKRDFTTAAQASRCLASRLMPLTYLFPSLMQAQIPHVPGSWRYRPETLTELLPSCLADFAPTQYLIGPSPRSAAFLRRSDKHKARPLQ